MRVFNFTKVIYDGNASLDLFIFFVKQKYSRIFSFFKLLGPIFMWVTKRGSMKDIMELFYQIILADITISEIELFKVTNAHKVDLEGFGIIKDTNDYVIITSEPTFIVDLFINRNKFNVICTEFDTRSFKIIGKLCVGEEKLNRLRQVGINAIKELYIFSFQEKALMKISEQILIYRNAHLIEFETYEVTLYDRIRYSLLTYNFFAFLMFTIVSMGVVFILSTIFSFGTNPIVAFSIAYLIALALNFIINYHYKTINQTSINAVIGYFLTFLPNYLFLLFAVLVLSVILPVPLWLVVLVFNVIAFPLIAFVVRFLQFQD